MGVIGWFEGSSPHTRGAPACRPPRPGGRGDHPRIRGEHHLPEVLDDGCVGIIPAYAGSTIEQLAVVSPYTGSSPHTRGALPPPTRSCGPCRDHPRIRGEHERAKTWEISDQRIIPAYAGSTLNLDSAEYDREGSSPHTRGAHGKRH